MSIKPGTGSERRPALTVEWSITFSPWRAVRRSRVAAGLLLVGGSLATGWALVLGLLAGAGSVAVLQLWPSLLRVAELFGGLGGGFVLVGVLLDQTRSLADPASSRPSGSSSSPAGQGPRN